MKTLVPSAGVSPYFCVEALTQQKKPSRLVRLDVLRTTSQPDPPMMATVEIAIEEEKMQVLLQNDRGVTILESFSGGGGVSTFSVSPSGR